MLLLNRKGLMCLLKHAFVASHRTSKYSSLTNQKVWGWLNEKNLRRWYLAQCQNKVPKDANYKIIRVEGQSVWVTAIRAKHCVLRHLWNVNLRVNNSCLLILRPIWNKRSAGLLAVCENNFYPKHAGLRGFIGKSRYFKWLHQTFWTFQVVYLRSKHCHFPCASVSKRVLSEWTVRWTHLLILTQTHNKKQFESVL